MSSQRSPHGGGDDPRELTEERRPIPSGEDRIHWRQGYLAADGLLVLLGIWLALSPLFVAYGSGDARWSPVASGALIALLALLGLRRLPRAVAAGLIMVVAAWLFVSSFWLAASAEASWNAGAGGALAFFLALAAAAASTERDAGSMGGPTSGERHSSRPRG
jgi:purine-cytosine permease-like protein